MKQAGTFPMLGIAGEFPSIKCKIADSLNLNGFAALTGAKLQVSFQDEAVRSGNIRRDSQTLIVHG